MARVAYNESLYRTGYRPYNTNPFAAAHGLSGASRYSPERQQEASVFTSRGGYTLKGLGAIVPDQSVVTYQGKWQSTWNMSPQDVINAVVSALNSNGFSVRNVASDAGMLANTKVLGIAEVQTFNVTLTLQVNTGQGGFGDPNDIISIVRHWVYTATGSMPLSDSIPSVQVPGAAAPAPTGQPSSPDAPTSSNTADVGSWLQNNFGTVAIFAIALVVAPPLIQSFMGRR